MSALGPKRLLTPQCLVQAVRVQSDYGTAQGDLRTLIIGSQPIGLVSHLQPRRSGRKRSMGLSSPPPPPMYLSPVNVPHTPVQLCFGFHSSLP